MDLRNDVAPIANSMTEWKEQLDRLSRREGPTFAHLSVQLPEQGRTNQVIAASSHMSVVLKTYAAGGENELHTHPNEDHVFLVLQGHAVFYGPNGETRRVEKHDCVMLPHGVVYRFMAEESSDALVMVRIGAVVNPGTDIQLRLDEKGLPIAPFNDPDNGPPLVLGNKWFD